jgi:predicted enzyme related to lactoylglutathione lyase
MTKETIASEPVGTLHAIVLDVNDLERCSRFWSEVLGKEISFKADKYCRVGASDDTPSLLLQKVPEQHEHKNRAHIDLDVTDLESAVQRVVDLGGTRLEEISEYGIRWAVMADPDGNEFCLVQHS